MRTPPELFACFGSACLRSYSIVYVPLDGYEVQLTIHHGLKLLSLKIPIIVVYGLLEMHAAF